MNFQKTAEESKAVSRKDRPRGANEATVCDRSQEVGSGCCRCETAWGGEEPISRVLSVHRSKCRSEVCFLCLVEAAAGRWSVTWDLGSDLALAWPDFGHVIPTHHLHYTQRTTHDIPIQHIIDSRPSRNPPYHRGHQSSRCQPPYGTAGRGTRCTRLGSYRSLILLIMEFLTSFRGLPLPLRI